MKYVVYGTVPVDVYFTVEADSEKEAIDLAYQDFPGLSNYAGNGGSGKLVGVSGRSISIEAGDCVEFFSAEVKDE